MGNPLTKRDRIKLDAFPVEQYPDVADTRCISVVIPNDDSYLSQLQGLVAIASRYWNYAGSNVEKKARAALWQMAWVLTEWEDCMDCEDVADCIAENEAVQAALAAWFSNAVDNDVIVQQALARAFNANQPGSAIPNGYANGNLYGAALGCDLDDGWGHIRGGLIERSFQRSIDALQTMAASSDNAAMLAEFINAIPAVGAFFDVIPVTDWFLWFDNARDWMADAFEAADTVDLRDEIACDLFCIWQVECSLSLEQIRHYYWSKTISLVPSWDGAFDSMSELATALGTLSTTPFGSAIVYAIMGSQYGFLTFINDWFGITIAATSSDLAVGEPSDDHTILCDTCPVMYCDDFTPEIGEFSYEVGVEYPFASFNICANTFDGEVGGTVTAGLGIDGGNAVVGVEVCSEGATITEAAVVIDFETAKTITFVSMRHMPFEVTGGNRQYIRLLDEFGVEVIALTQEGSNLEAWHTYAPEVNETGIRYIVYSNTQNGGAPRIGEICVTSEDE